MPGEHDPRIALVEFFVYLGNRLSYYEDQIEAEEQRRNATTVGAPDRRTRRSVLRLATVPAGQRRTRHAHSDYMKLLAVLALVASALTAAAANAASARHLAVSPTSVLRGGHVTVSGRGCRAGDVVYLISPPFVGNAFVEHSVGTKARANGHFARVVRIRSHIRAGRYTITARCGGGNLGVTAHLRVH
jgi:hypothetical protein